MADYLYHSVREVVGTVEDLKYCLCCDERVPFNILERNENREVTCSFCGFTLDVQKMPEDRKSAGSGCVMVADDSKYTRKIIEELIRERMMSSDILVFEDGLGLTNAYSRLLSEKRPVLVAILDLNMPVMDGVTAARTLRALEDKFAAAKVPIVFFSAEKADEDLKKQMKNLEPANYVNKGSDPDPDKLAVRVEYLLGHLMEKSANHKG